MIEEIIKQKLTDQFEKDLFDAALGNFTDHTNKLRFNNFAYAIRELTRHFLARLSPNGEIEKCSWYANETREPGKISRGERIRYAIQGGLDNNYVLDELGVDIPEINREFRRIVDLLSKFTHIESATFNLDNTTAEDYKLQTLKTLLEFFTLIEQSRDEVLHPLREEIDDHVFALAISETHQEIDEVATHHWIDSVDVYAHEIDQIDSGKIFISVYGNFEVTLEYGSASDHRRGDGATIHHSFPFKCKFKCLVSSPNTIFESAYDLEIDQSGWYGE